MTNQIDTVELAKLVSSLPLTVLLLLVLVGGYMDWWVYGTIHRAQLVERDKLVDLERARASQWESRFLEISVTVNSTLKKTEEIGHAVNGGAAAAARKLKDLEQQVIDLHAELLKVQTARVTDANARARG